MLPQLLLDWYDRCRRNLPWRAAPGKRPNPYRVWLSEIMLQQTRVETVKPYYRKFLKRWPTVKSLAASEVDDVLDAWAGLGYYARARNLHACARAVMETYGGKFPRTPEALRTLPGVGEYTANAIAAIVSDQPVAAVDGNVERIMARLYAVERVLPDARPELHKRAQAIMPRRRAGDFVQAMMELGATVCVPRSPRCGTCPLADLCEGRCKGIAKELPRQKPGRPKPLRYGVAYCLKRDDGAVLMERRPPRGLLGGTLGLPGTEWRETRPDRAAMKSAMPMPGRWRKVGVVRHGFTHFVLELEVKVARLEHADSVRSGHWVDGSDLEGLPTVMGKALRLVSAEQVNRQSHSGAEERQRHVGRSKD